MTAVPMSAGSAPVSDAMREIIREVIREELRAARPPPADGLIPAREVATLTGVRSLGTLTRRVKAGTFPPPDGYAGEFRMWKRSTVENAIAVHAATPRTRRRRGVAAWTPEQHSEREGRKAKARKSRGRS
jgi:predicted DNA-binding transcriptional regulator AlpA